MAPKRWNCSIAELRTLENVISIPIPTQEILNISKTLPNDNLGFDNRLGCLKNNLSSTLSMPGFSPCRLNNNNNKKATREVSKMFVVTDGRLESEDAGNKARMDAVGDEGVDGTPFMYDLSIYQILIALKRWTCSIVELRALEEVISTLIQTQDSLRIFALPSDKLVFDIRLGCFKNILSSTVSMVSVLRRRLNKKERKKGDKGVDYAYGYRLSIGAREDGSQGKEQHERYEEVAAAAVTYICSLQ